MKNYKLLLHVLAPAKKSLLLTLIFSFFTVAANIALLATSAWLIATAALHPELMTLSLAIVGVRFYGISRAVFRYLERYVSHHMAFQGLYALRVWFYKRLEPLAPAILKRVDSGDILGRIMGDIETLQFFYLRVLVPPITALLITACTGYYLSLYSRDFLYLLAGAFIVGGLGIPILVWRHNSSRHAAIFRERSLIKSEITESLAGMHDIVAFGNRESIKTSLQARFACLEREQERVSRGNYFGEAVLQWTMYTTAILSFLISIPLSQQGQGVYIAVMALLFQSYFECLQPLSLALHYKQASLCAAERLHNMSPAHIRTEVEKTKNVNEPLQASDIEFDKISFSYEETPILQDFSLRIKKGERVAIVGPSGSGKTTLFMILNGFYSYGGTIRMGTYDKYDFSTEQWRSLFGVMEQEPYLFHATIEENLRLAKPQATAEEVDKAIASAHLTKFVQSLPQGLQTVVGSGGNAVSGGQRQRMALARIYLKNAPVLLLDEPLEGLDQMTRKDVQNSLFELMEGKTTLYITHQLDGLEKMDRIIFLEDGRILETGTYEELMAKREALFTYVSLSMDRLA